ncbi:MAG: cytochrome C biogenesis protein [Acidobacteria bacterium RIFCSPLOWO2_02_FULL_59_13]|nr:MAG: cytochrome C biogenesis protein [Acidobacteria bacterium RIFCSPLOWO2_02_FULL_59_13]
MESIASFALLLALVLAAYAIAASIGGALRQKPRLQYSAYRATAAIWVLVTVATGCLVYSLLADDFRLVSVAGHSNRALPWYYKITALWSGQEGSLLFWSWLLAGYSVAAVWLNREKHRPMMPYVVAALMVVQGFFLILNVFVAPPFQLLAINEGGQMVVSGPLDGNGLNPLLQYPAMAIHPPMLYLGYVGFSVPFAFALATLITRQAGEKWIETTRRWTMLAWLFLSMGVLLGARWAYAVLGWGGYWGWDPVENASLMPWFAGTAFLHSVMMQEKRGMMKVWNMVLIFSTFFLCIFGTFLTRSGVVSSVHAFAQSPIGPFFVGFLGIGILSSGWLLLERLDYLKSASQLDSLVSRESSFLFNNLLLLAACFSVLWGTLFPVISEAVQGVKISVGAPFFNKVNIPIGLVLLFLTGVGPLFAWRKTSLGSLRKNFLVPGLISLALGALLLVLGIRKFYPQVSFILCAFVVITIVMEFYRGSHVIRGKTGQSLLGAAVTLTRRNTRRYGGYIVHFGIVLMFIGFTGTAFNQEVEREMLPGDQMNLGFYTLLLRDLSVTDNPNYSAQHAVLELYRGERSLGMLRPERRFYKASRQPTTEVAIRPRLNEDLYVVFSGIADDNQHAVINAHLNPLVNWIWIGGFVLVLGTLIALVPSSQPARSEQVASERPISQPTQQRMNTKSRPRLPSEVPVGSSARS